MFSTIVALALSSNVVGYEWFVGISEVKNPKEELIIKVVEPEKIEVGKFLVELKNKNNLNNFKDNVLEVSLKIGEEVVIFDISCGYSKPVFFKTKGIIYKILSRCIYVPN